MKLPKYIEFIINQLEKANYHAFVVGGAVRDCLLNKKPLDYDIATNATPDQIKKVFWNKRIIDTGIKHGTISVMMKKKRIEITTFRQEIGHENYRRPKKVIFIDELKQDLARRDFTMNAIAYRNQFYDYFNGMIDIKNQCIRCVGIPEIRFEEDALRILRALRFSCQLHFSIEEQTKQAIFEYKELLKYISKERIYDEWIKMIHHDVNYVIPMYNSVFQTFMPSISEYELNWLAKNNKYLKDDVLKATAIVLKQKNSDLLKLLNYPKKIIQEVEIVLNNIDITIPNNIYEVKKILINLHKIDLIRIVRIQKLLKKKTCTFSLIKKIPKETYGLDFLAINGSDLIKLGYPRGEIIAHTLLYLLKKVIDEEIINEKTPLLEQAKKIKKMQ